MDIKAGKKFLQEKNYVEAEKVFLNLIKNNNDLLLSNFYLGGIYFELDNYDKSKLYYENCLKLKPNSIQTLINLADLEQTHGKIEAAKEIYEKLISLFPENIRAYYGIYLLNDKYLKNIYESIFKKIVSKNNNLYESGIAYYLLSKISKSKDNLNDEIDFLEKSHNDIFKSKLDYNNQSNFYYQKIISKKFNQIEYLNLEKKKNKNQKQFFIIGLPRSGSTLVENLLSNVKGLSDLGENAFVNMGIVNQVANKIFEKNFRPENFVLRLDHKKLDKFVLNKFKERIKDKDRLDFIDKTLVNFFNIEIILNIFPDAKFIHCFRNIKDSIIAIYQSLLPSLSWTHNLDDIIDYIDNYLRVIKFFKTKYPDKIFDVNLEELTKNNIKESKKIFEFCGLNWRDNYVNFEGRKDLIIKTTSNIQLRSNIKKYNNKKYINYYKIFNKYKKNYEWLSSK